MTYRKKTDFNPHIPPEQATICHSPGCTELGTYKAPKSREAISDYLWFCLEHVREHNQKWDYFSGMNSEQIESFIKDSVTGHRPTWDRESRTRFHYAKLQDALYEFMHEGKPAPKPAPPLSSKLRKALAALELDYPYTQDMLKTQYRLLVKKHHPDVNEGTKESEEIFKRITAAYRTLSEHLN